MQVKARTNEGEYCKTSLSEYARGKMQFLPGTAAGSADDG